MLLYSSYLSKKFDILSLAVSNMFLHKDGKSKFINDIKPNPANTIPVASNGEVGNAFYQSKEFLATGDVNILYPAFKLNPFIAMFLSTIIMQEKFRFDYGRKWGKEKMLEHKIKLPIDSKGKPNWQFMEDYIKSLPYSKNL